MPALLGRLACRACMGVLGKPGGRTEEYPASVSAAAKSSKGSLPSTAVNRRQCILRRLQSDIIPEVQQHSAELKQASRRTLFSILAQHPSTKEAAGPRLSPAP